VVKTRLTGGALGNLASPGSATPEALSDIRPAAAFLFYWEGLPFL
jgi:hypothetical protein